MTKLTVTYTPDGCIQKELHYKENVFTYTMIPHDGGKTSDRKSFPSQVSELFPNEPDDVLDALDALDFADENEIEEHLLTLSHYEEVVGI